MTAATLQRTADDLAGRVPADLPPGTMPPPGVSLAVRTRRLADSAVAGYRVVRPETRSPDGALPMTPGTAHDLASVTKVLATTTCLIRLVSDGALSLEDTVGRFIPSFAHGDKADVSVRDLLRHRGGLWEWHPLYLAAGDREAALRFAAEMPLRYRPNTGRHYSDLGFMLLGEIVAEAAGQALDDAVRTLVTEPLGLASTRYRHPAGPDVAASACGDRAEMRMIDSGDPYPVPYRSGDFPHWRTGIVSGDVNDGNAFHALRGVSGHAGLFSTVPDLIRFATVLAEYADHDALWKPAVAEEFFAEGPDQGQSLGFRRYPFRLGGERVHLLGHPGFVGCAVGFVPGAGIAVAMATNRLLTPGTPVPTEQLWRAALATTEDLLEEHR